MVLVIGLIWMIIRYIDGSVMFAIKIFAIIVGLIFFSCLLRSFFSLPEGEHSINEKLKFTLNNLKQWVARDSFGSFLQGIGLCMMGSAAILALSHADVVLENLFKIRKQASKIDRGVEEIKAAVKMLEYQLNGNYASQKIQNSSLKNPEATEEEIQKTIESIPSEPSCGVSIYLPQEYRSQGFVKKLQNKTPEERQFVLQNALQYKAPPANCSVQDQPRGPDSNQP